MSEQKQGMSTNSKRRLLAWGLIFAAFVLGFLFEHILRGDDTGDSLAFGFVCGLLMTLVIGIGYTLFELIPKRH